MDGCLLVQQINFSIEVQSYIIDFSSDDPIIWLDQRLKFFDRGMKNILYATICDECDSSSSLLVLDKHWWWQK